jgi:hypothetical protein
MLPSPDEVRSQLARIVGSPEFVVPERARSLLSPGLQFAETPLCR